MLITIFSQNFQQQSFITVNEQTKKQQGSSLSYGSYTDEPNKPEAESSRTAESKSTVAETQPA